MLGIVAKIQHQNPEQLNLYGESKMTQSQFTEWYSEVGKMAAARLAVCNGVPLAQVQLWIARIEKNIHHLVIN